MKPASTAELIILRDAAKRYGWRGRWVLRGVNLTIRRGALIRLVGINGSGKSTLLRLLAGATLPTRGRRLCPQPISIGYAPDRLLPAPPFSAVGYLRHHAWLRGLTHEQSGRRVAELAERLDLGELLHERLATLSKGLLQKVALAQAFLAVPGLVVLDEPFGGLDAKSERALHGLLVDCSARGATVVFSAHHTAAAGLPAEFAWQVGDGQVHVAGAPPR